ncbi:hypothetical protein COLO4_18513 [Corchorus olitorius]|uniref:Pentacotripeptide-repeat region of PRORP domain-containing protein n=1 Tax=Corchorus olitorius TaxID=93759 RepID=A0A1R3J8T5_9ROSI|nr:hypothetical protein COLO4_18513 [Corchorus olitorius]
MLQTPQALTLILKMLKNPPLKALSLFESSILQGVQHTPDTIAITLDILLSSNMLFHSQSLLLQMLDRNLLVGPHTLNNVLGFLIKSDSFEKAWILFTESKKRVKLDVYSFGIMIKGCCDAGDLSKSFELLGQLEELDLSPNVVIYTTLIDGCCKNGDFEQAKMLFDKMGEIGLVPNEYTYTVLINGLFKKGLKKDGFELYQKMQLNGVIPNLYTYNSVMKEYCNEGKVRFARARDAAVVAGLVKEMEERGIKPSKVTYTIVIDAFMKSENTERAFELYQFMQKAGLVPDVYTCGVLIHGLCTKGNMKEARKLFESMEEMQLKPNDVIYNTMIHGYCKEGSSYRALRMVREMGEKGLVPNVASYSSTIGLLCKDGKWQEAEALLNEMIESGFEPTVSLYNIISEAKHET